MELRALRKGKSVLRLTSREGATKSGLPSPVLYMGLTNLSVQSTTAASSDAFKICLVDPKGESHLLPDATVAKLYLEVDEETRRGLIRQYWPGAE